MKKSVAIAIVAMVVIGFIIALVYKIPTLTPTIVPAVTPGVTPSSTPGPTPGLTPYSEPTIVPMYLFSWDSVPGNDSNRLLMFLKDDFDINRVENAKIIKTDDSKTISVFTEEKSVEIVLDENKENVILKISDGLTYDLQVKEENGKLNIYVPMLKISDDRYVPIPIPPLPIIDEPPPIPVPEQ